MRISENLHALIVLRVEQEAFLYKSMQTMCLQGIIDDMQRVDQAIKQAVESLKAMEEEHERLKKQMAKA